MNRGSGPSTAQNALASVGGTAIAEACTYPACTAFTRLIASGTRDQGASFISVLRTMRKEGVASFYRGAPVAVTNQVFSSACKYVLLREAMRHSPLADKLETPMQRVAHHGALAIVSGVASTTLTHPLDWVKNQLQQNRAVIPQLRAQPPLLYRGWTKGALKAGIGGAAWLGLFVSLTEEAKFSPFHAAAVTGLAAPAITGCLNTLKVRATIGVSTGESLQSLVRARGWANGSWRWTRNAYQGNAVNILRVWPHFVIAMTCTEWIRHRQQ